MPARKIFSGLKNDRIRSRILLPFAFVILSVIAAFVVATYLYEQHQITQGIKDRVTKVERLFHQGLEQDSQLMFALLEAISRDEKIRQDYLSGNREVLLKRVWPLFHELRKNNHITHFYFSGRDRVNFLRVHQPDRYGDTINRITTLRAAESRQGARGIELGKLGTLTMRVVIPWYDGNQLIGYLELGEEINHITQEVHEVLGVDILVLVDEKFLDPVNWEAGKQIFGHQGEWDHFGSSLVVGRSMDTIPEALVTAIDQHKQEEAARVLKINEQGQELFVAFRPLTDISDREVGSFIVVQDLASMRSGFYSTILLVALLSVLIGSVVYTIFYVLLSRVERDYQQKHEIEIQLSRVNTETQKLIQVEKLSATGLMVSEIAHQLNNPLAGVINMAQLAARETDNPERTKDLLTQISMAGKDCHAFVGRMLEFTKLSCFDHKSTDMNRLIEETISLFEESSSPKAEIKLKLPARSPMLDIDPVLIRHALFNLLSNAAESTPEGGVITVTLAAGARPQGTDAGWNLSVRDQGTGIAEQIVSKIFTPFFTTRSKGTGLGLPVVQHVAILHEGEITVSNMDDGGAFFALWLPDNQVPA